MPQSWFEQNAPARSTPQSGWFAQNAPKRNTAQMGGDPTGTATIPESTIGTRARELTTGILENFDVSKLPELGRQFVQHPIDTTVAAVEGVVTAPIHAGMEIGEGLMEGDYDKVAHGVGSGIGFVGGLAAGTPEAKALAGKIKLPTALKRTNAVQDAAIAAAKAQGLPIDLATKTQSAPLKYAKMTTDVTPIVSRHGARFTLELDNALTEAIGKFGGTSKSDAGQFTKAALKHQVETLQGEANKAYEAVRAGAKETPIEIGTEASMDAYTGLSSKRPITKNVKGPTDLRDVKAAANKIISEIEKEIPMAQRDASPGFSALKQISALDDVTDLATADSALGQLKAIVRDSKSPRFSDVPALRTRAQGIAAAIIRPMTEAIDDAAEAAGVSELLAKGRAATRQKWAIGDLLSGLSEEPVRAVEYLTAQGDRSITALTKVLKAAPPARTKIGQSIIQGILERATSEGGFKADRALADWNRLGAETKTALYQEQAAKIENLFQYGKLAKQNVNPSGSGKAVISAATGAAMLKDPLTTIIGYIGLETTARMIYSPKGAAILERVGKLMPTAPGIGIGLIKAAGRTFAASTATKGKK